MGARRKECCQPGGAHDGAVMLKHLGAHGDGVGAVIALRKRVGAVHQHMVAEPPDDRVGGRACHRQVVDVDQLPAVVGQVAAARIRFAVAVAGDGREGLD